MKTIGSARSVRWVGFLVTTAACNTGDVLLGSGDAGDAGLASAVPSGSGDASDAGFASNTVPTVADGAAIQDSTGIGDAGATGDAANQEAVIAVSVGADSACALTAKGGVLCWGNNQSGQLGNNSTVASPVPVPVTGLASGVAAISVGASSACALTAGGGVQCWGNNPSGQLGNDSKAAYSPVPVTVTGLASGAIAVSVGYGSMYGSSSTCAVVAGGGVECWGNNDSRQLGNNSTVPYSSLPVFVTGLASGAVAVSVGYGFACALNETGGVQCWGGNQSGQLGANSTAAFSAVPVPIMGLPVGITAVSVGEGSACALAVDGAVACWGSIAQGLFVSGPSGPVSVAGLSSGVTALSMGSQSPGACALAGGQVECWGETAQCGYAYPPITVTGLGSAATQLSVGGFSDCVVGASGVECWGDSYSENPVPVAGVGGTHNP